jgi:hypothetical protein
MSFSFELRLADGDDAGTFETSASDWKVGDTLIADGNRRYRVTAVLAPERLAEFVDGVENGVLEVEPLLGRAATWRSVPGQRSQGRPTQE